MVLLSVFLFFPLWQERRKQERALPTLIGLASRLGEIVRCLRFVARPVQATVS